jgi:hypothetical protein
MQDQYSLEDYKRQAKALRAELGDLSHAQALELVAKQHGARNWNTLHASLANAPRKAAYAPGQRVSGSYLGQRFEGVIKAVRAIGSDGHCEITLRFDAPVDVVRFHSFSSLRRQVIATIDWTGRTLRKTSDGHPHLILDI